MKYRIYCKRTKSFLDNVFVSQDGKFYEQTIVGLSEIKGRYEVHLMTDAKDCEGISLFENDWVALMDDSGTIYEVGEICYSSFGVSYRGLCGSTIPLSNCVLEVKFLGSADKGRELAIKYKEQGVYNEKRASVK